MISISIVVSLLWENRDNAGMLCHKGPIISSICSR